MPASPGAGPRRSARTPREWGELDTAHGFERCVRATLRELYGYVALLCGRDRRQAERVVGEVYRSLFRAVRAGHADTVTLGALRSAARRTWLDAHRDELAAIDEVSRAPASTIAELSSLERAVLVLRHVNGMSIERCAVELGRSERDVKVLSAHAVRRLRGTDDTSGAWLRAYLGPSVSATPGLVDRIVRGLGDEATADTAPIGVETPTAELTSLELAELEAAPSEDAEPAEVEAAPSEDAEPAAEPTVVAAEEDRGHPEDAAELPTTELAVVDRPTVELPTVEPPTAEPPTIEHGPESEAMSGTAAFGSARDGVAGDGATSTDPDESAVTGRRPPTWVVAIGAVLVAALVAALIWLALRGDTGDTVVSAPPTSEPATSSTTAAASTTTTVPPTTVAAGAVELGFDPACVEQTGAEPAVVTVPDTLGPLAAEPALVVTTPESVDVAADPERAPARPEAIVRSDGVIVSAHAAAGHRALQTIVSRIGLDGTVAWVRCLAGEVEVAADPGAGIDLAIRPVGDEGSWTALAVADGATGEPLDGVQSAILDAPDAAPSPGDGPTLGFSYDSGRQRTVPAGLDDGSVLWTASDVVLPAADAPFRAIAVDGVALVQSCVETEGGVDCAAGELRAYDLVSGDQLWARPGEHQVAASGGGVALVGDGERWELVDVDTGAVVDGQRWDDPDTFAVDPADPAASVQQVGGVVVVIRSGSVSVWLPIDLGGTAAAESTGVTIP